ncbi:hypothetical protein RRG08_048512, partial [Elysia crispata]
KRPPSYRELIHLDAADSEGWAEPGTNWGPFNWSAIECWTRRTGPENESGGSDGDKQ